MKIFHSMLTEEFSAAEVESLATLESELASGNFYLTAVSDPVSGRMVGAIYGSIFSCDEGSIGIAVRFQLSEEAVRGTGVSENGLLRFLDDVRDVCNGQSDNVAVVLCEAVDRSENY